ncbi:MAG: hypothetical protein WCP62_09345, partial [Planctomycetota bacterium]
FGFGLRRAAQGDAEYRADEKPWETGSQLCSQQGPVYDGLLFHKCFHGNSFLSDSFYGNSSKNTLPETFSSLNESGRLGNTACSMLPLNSGGNIQFHPPLA